MNIQQFISHDKVLRTLAIYGMGPNDITDTEIPNSTLYATEGVREFYLIDNIDLLLFGRNSSETVR